MSRISLLLHETEGETGLSSTAFDHQKIIRYFYLILKDLLLLKLICSSYSYIVDVDHTCYKCEQHLMFLRVITAVITLLMLW